MRVGMPKALIVVGHADIDSSCLNRKITKALESEDVTLHYLSRLYPDYKINTKREQDLLIEHQHIVLLFPLYWYSCPAILKKWLDDVFLPGFAYLRGGDKLAGKTFQLVVTVGAPESGYRAGGINNFTIDELLRPFQQTVTYVKGKYLPPLAVYESVFLSEEAADSAATRVVSKMLSDYVSPEVIYEELLQRAELADVKLLKGN